MSKKSSKKANSSLHIGKNKKPRRFAINEDDHAINQLRKQKGKNESSLLASASTRLIRRSDSESEFTQSEYNEVGHNDRWSTGEEEEEKIDNMELNKAVRRMNWKQSDAAEAMVGGVKKTLTRQNEANSVIWYNTLFGPEPEGRSLYSKKIPKKPENEIKVDGKRNQKSIYKAQQLLLRRYFLALADLGPMGGDQNDNKYDYVPLEYYKNKKERVGLATLASGGGLINFRSDDQKTGKEFWHFIYGMNPARDQIETWEHQKSHPTELVDKGTLGAYYRIASHDSEIDDGKIKEVDYTANSSDGWLGINIPLGGLGQKLKTNYTDNEVTTGFQGISHNNNNKTWRHKQEILQTGAVLAKHYPHGEYGSNTLIGFENSAPNAKNIFGIKHGAGRFIQTKASKIRIAKKPIQTTLTGQGKRSKWGVEYNGKDLSKTGSRIVQVKSKKLKELEQKWIRVKDWAEPKQREFYKALLMSTTQAQRERLMEENGLTVQNEPMQRHVKRKRRRTSEMENSFPSTLMRDIEDTEYKALDEQVEATMSKEDEKEEPRQEIKIEEWENDDEESEISELSQANSISSLSR